jgi:hypothetical protein
MTHVAKTSATRSRGRFGFARLVRRSWVMMYRCIRNRQADFGPGDAVDHHHDAGMTARAFPKRLPGQCLETVAVVSRRMDKSQQMRWPRNGANLLLQVRCVVWAPPAQIRTCDSPAYGSHLGCLTAKRTFGQGCRIRGLGSHSSASWAIRSHVVRSHVVRSFWLRRRSVRPHKTLTWCQKAVSARLLVGTAW